MDQSLFKYEIVAEDPKTHARAGILHTPHGDIETPIFMPVGTKANVKGIPTETVKDLGAQIVLANTYHLAMRPGADTVAELGGLHDFMNWHGPILTDSGGFQIFSHSDAVKLTDEGVRFIAINDGVDSAQGDNDLTPLKNLFNEWMVRDTSKKIKAVKKAKGMSGKPVTSKPVYGYLMDEDENFIIDEEAAPVVKQIYNLCLAGNGPTKIARMLTEQQIPTPGTLEYRRTGSTRRYHPGYECKWATNTVVHILENREYTGCLVNFKTEKLSYKVKHSVENPPEKQVIFENHHEPIIDTQTWERVQELRKQRKRPNRYDEVGLFSGILFCADCGSVMYQQRYQTDKRKQDCYICGNYKKRTHDCTAHFIRTDLLTAGVLSNLRKVTSYAAKHEARFMKLLIEQNEDGDRRRNAAKKKELEAAEKRIAELSAIFKRLYEDSVTGRISDERFTELSADYEAEQKELKERAARLREELSKAQEATANAEKFMNVVRRHTTIEELTPTLLREFVEKIVVHESVALDGKRRGKLRRQEIEIYYSFVGKVELPDT